MNIVRWIFAIPVAFCITIGTYSYVDSQIDLRRYFSGLNLIALARSIEFVIVFSASVILSCLFAPRPKKYAALAAVVLVTVLMGLLVCYEYILSQRAGLHTVPTIALESNLSFFAGSSIGFALSYLIFKNNGWYPELMKTETPEIH
jgi:hypothetical protein